MGVRFLPAWLSALPMLAAAIPCLYASAEFVPCKNNYSPTQQIELGDKAKAQVYKTTPVLPDSSPVTRYIEQLGARLASQAPGYKWPYNFHVANVAEINAFALPGGSVFVNLGSIQAAANESQLAGAMAHEISHVVLQHAVCNAEKQQKIGIFAGLGQLAAGVLLGDAAGSIAQEGIGLTTGLGFLKMSRGAERQADLEGAGIAYDAGYDPRGLPQFFQTIESRYGAGGSQFLSDHPNPGNRTEYLDKEIASYPPKSGLIEDSPEFERMKSQVAHMRAYTAKEVASGIWKTQSSNQDVGSGISRPAGPPPDSIRPNLDTSGPWRQRAGAGWSLRIPASWKVYGNQSSAMIGPSGGIAAGPDGAASNVIYGVLTDRYRPQPGIRGAAAVDALVAEIAGDNPGFKAGHQSLITAGGVNGRSVECDIPTANRGRGEHDWLVAFPQDDGSWRYFVFVAPAPDFEKMRPAFERILNSIAFQN